MRVIIPCYVDQYSKSTSYFSTFLGLWKLEVSHNDVSEIPSMAFYGLERALWELHLSHNKLIRVPADSITLLKKLSVLNLAGKARI